MFSSNVEPKTPESAPWPTRNEISLQAARIVRINETNSLEQPSSINTGGSLRIVNSPDNVMVAAKYSVREGCVPR